MSNARLFLAIGIPLAVNAATLGLLMLHINHRFGEAETFWQVELRRFELALDARLKHLEERIR